MSDLRKTAQMALEALEMEATSPPITETGAAIDALRAALAQPEPPQRKPLTEEEIEYIAPVSFTWRDMVTFARMIEHEHGIGGEE